MTTETRRGRGRPKGSKSKRTKEDKARRKALIAASAYWSSFGEKASPTPILPPAYINTRGSILSIENGGVRLSDEPDFEYEVDDEEWEEG